MSRFGYLNKKAEMVQRWPIHLHLSPLFCFSEAQFKSGSLSDCDDDNACCALKMFSYHCPLRGTGIRV